MPPELQRQTDKPLFPEVFWSRPTLKSRGGRLLIAGGQKNEFNLLQNIYQVAEAAGVGYAQAAMPASLQKLVGGGEFGRFLPATASGSLARNGLGELLDIAEDYDAVVVGANLTNNSETAILVESFIERTEQPLIITKEAIDAVKLRPDLITGNPHATVVATMLDTYKLASNHNMPVVLRRNQGLMGKLEVIQQLVSISKCNYVVFDDEVIVAARGKLSVTPLARNLGKEPAIMVGLVATFAIQQRNKPFAGLTAAAFMARGVSRETSSSDPTGAPTKAIRNTLASLEQ